jgi:hypothetical protein
MKLETDGDIGLIEGESSQFTLVIGASATALEERAV